MSLSICSAGQTSLQCPRSRGRRRGGEGLRAGLGRGGWDAQEAGTETPRAKDSKMTEEEECINEEPEL